MIKDEYIDQIHIYDFCHCFADCLDERQDKTEEVEALLDSGLILTDALCNSSQVQSNNNCSAFRI